MSLFIESVDACHVCVWPFHSLATILLVMKGATRGAARGAVTGAVGECFLVIARVACVVFVCYSRMLALLSTKRVTQSERFVEMRLKAQKLEPPVELWVVPWVDLDNIDVPADEQGVDFRNVYGNEWLLYGSARLDDCQSKMNSRNLRNRSVRSIEALTYVFDRIIGLYFYQDPSRQASEDALQRADTALCKLVRASQVSREPRPFLDTFSHCNASSIHIRSCCLFKKRAVWVLCHSWRSA